MKITKDMNVTIALDSSQGKYISITQKGNTLEVKRAAKKPKGGAKATLAKIQKILEEIDIDDESKTSLAKISKQIDEGYSKKNDVNDEKFFYKNHSKKVHALAARISHLTTFPVVPVDVFKFMVEYLDVQDLGRLAQVSKSANTPVSSDWPRRAKALGWPGDNDPKEAKAFCKNVTKCLDKLGLHSVANQFISAPEKKLDLQTLEKIGDKISSSYVDFHFHSIHHSKGFEPFLYFLAHKTASLKAPVNCPWGFHVLFKHIQWNKAPASSTLLPLATLMANINYLPNLSWFATSDIDQNEATAILDLFPAVDLNLNSPYPYSRDYTTPLYKAVFEGHLGWAKALVEKKGDPNKDSRLDRGDGQMYLRRPIEIAVKNKNTEMISLLTGAKADIPKSNRFLHELMRDNSSDQVLLILDRLHEENHVHTPSFMNNRYLMDVDVVSKTLLQRAIKYNHPQEVLEKLVEMGAEITPTKRRDSPLLYARDHKKIQAAVWLTDQGASIPAKKK